MKKTGLSLILFLLVFFLTATPGFTCPMHHSQAGPEMSVKEILFKKVHLIFDHQDLLKLNEDQLAKIKKLKLDTKKSLIIKDAEIEVTKLEFKSLLKDDPMDLGAINTKIDQKYELKKQKDKLLTSALADLKSVLTSQQKETLKSLYNSDQPKKTFQKKMK